MWTLTTICVIGMIIFLSFSLTIIVSYEQISLWLRLGVLFTFIPALIGIIILFSSVAYLDNIKKEKKVEYVPITYTVYKKK